METILTDKQNIDLEKSWLKHLKSEFDQPYMQSLKVFLQKEKQQYQVFPPGNQIFNALNTTPFDKARVIILGQDPYHGPGQAMGLSFSVPKGVAIPPSLRNMFKELQQSLDVPFSAHGDLTHWAKQGVLLLNTTLTVRSGAAKSHAGQGWETFTDKIIQVLNEHKQNLIFVLWGRHAGQKRQLINEDKHNILYAAHPSPLSAHNGFFGCQHFKLINEHLQSHSQTPIEWALPQ